MLNFHVFKYSMFSLSASISIVVFMAMFSGFLLLPIYAQEILRFTPMESGLMLLPGALISAVMSPINGRLFDKFGGRFLAVLGLSILIVTTYLFSHLTLHTTFVQIAVLHAIRMFGMSMVMMPVQTNGLNQLPPHLYPHGTAMNNTLNQVSGAIGTALLITIMSLREKTYAVQLSKEAIANSVNGTISAEVKQQIAMKAMLGGINDTFFISCVIIVVALILAFFMKRATQENNE